VGVEGCVSPSATTCRPSRHRRRPTGLEGPTGPSPSARPELNCTSSSCWMVHNTHRVHVRHDFPRSSPTAPSLACIHQHTGCRHNQPPPIEHSNSLEYLHESNSAGLPAHQMHYAHGAPPDEHSPRSTNAPAGGPGGAVLHVIVGYRRDAEPGEPS
jgi:hypothetical protein